MRVFTFKCVVSTFVEEGTALTKKQAKHEAARKMIERITDVVSDDLIINTASEKIDTAEEISQRIAQLKYPELSVLHCDIVRSKTNWGLKVIDFHKNIKRNYEDEMRTKIIFKLEELLSFINKSKQDNFSSTALTDIKEELKNILESLDFEFHLLQYLSVKKSSFIVGVQITTAPDIQEIGVGKSQLEAEYTAIYKAVSSLIFFFE